MDGSRRITTRNRRHLRRIPGREEEEEEEDEDDSVVTSTPVPVPEPSAPEPVPEQESEPVPASGTTPAPAPGSSPVSTPVSAPTFRRSSREKMVPDRLEVNMKGKTYAAVVRGNQRVGVGGGKKDVSERDVHRGHAGHGHLGGQPLRVAPIS